MNTTILTSIVHEITEFYDVRDRSRKGAGSPHMKYMFFNCKNTITLGLKSVLLAGVLFFGSPSGAHGQSGCRMTPPIFKVASEIRGLRIQKKVPCKRHSKKRVEKYLRETVDEKVNPAKLESEEIVYKLIGLIPEDYEYKEGMIELYLSSLGGYYEPGKKLFVMADWLPDGMQANVIAHELTHALQDQHFSLESFIDPNSNNSDSMVARSALVEGDATAVMLDYSRRLSGRPSIATEQVVSQRILNSLGSSNSPTFQAAPKSLQALMTFPYKEGLVFAHALMREGGYDMVSRAFQEPPRSSREILHPEEYLTRVRGNRKASLISPPETLEALPKVYEDRIGEFGLRALFSNYIGSSRQREEIAAGLSDDVIALYQKEDQRSLYWQLEWDSSKDKDTFVKYFEILTGKKLKRYRQGRKYELQRKLRFQYRMEPRVLTLYFYDER